MKCFLEIEYCILSSMIQYFMYISDLKAKQRKSRFEKTRIHGLIKAFKIEFVFLKEHLSLKYNLRKDSL